MTWLESFTRATRYTGPMLRLHRSRPQPSVSSQRPVSSEEARDECSMTYIIESLKWRDSRVRSALEYLKALETDPEADDFAIVWARHELQRCLKAAREDILRDG